uniref:S-layer homology domain-containing protein n=1 Tax=Aetokthonos hydrillicola TaxID=1550245 RepID=UPI001ABB720D
MLSFFRSSFNSAVLLTLGITASATSIVISDPALAQTTPPIMRTPSSQYPYGATRFSDVGADYWARPFIQALAERNVITGFPNGTFQPDQPVDRADFAAMIT